MHHVITLLGQKGGTGKTTLTTALAVAAHLSGYKTAIIDTDPQESALSWKEQRGDDTKPNVYPCAPDAVAGLLEDLKALNLAYVFIDTPGKAGGKPNEIDPDALHAVRAADLVLIPARFQKFEIDTLGTAAATIAAAGQRRAAIVLNGAHPNATDPTRSINRVAAAMYRLPVASAFICHRHIYAVAPQTGQGPHEREPGGKAAQEIDRLFQYIRAAIATDQPTTKARSAQHG